VALNHRKAQFAMFLTISSDHSASNVSRVEKRKMIQVQEGATAPTFARSNSNVMSSI
jgi:hypothetical protein